MTRHRKYQQSHPWITFQADFREAPAQLWLLLGEAVAMCGQIAAAPVRPEVSTEMHKIYFAKGVLATTAIEGNTLSEEEVRAQIDGRLEVPPSKAYLKQEIENVIDACNTIWRQIVDGEVPQLSADLIKHYNRLVLEKLGSLEDGVIPGEIFSHNVTVGSVYRAAPREDCDYLLDRLAEWLNGLNSRLWPGWEHPTEVPMAVIKAVLAHLYIAWIHPFGDGNGRAARLVEFLILASAGVPTPVAHLLSNHYNDTRTEYYRQLDRASKTGGKVFPFLLYAVQGLVDGLDGQLDFIRREHLDIAWQSYVHERFRDLRRSEAAARQRDLVLDLGLQPEPVPKHKLREISPRIAARYAGSTMKTVSRDVNKLSELGLIRYSAGGYVANTSIMLGFTPFFRRPPNSGEQGSG